MSGGGVSTMSGTPGGLGTSGFLGCSIIGVLGYRLWALGFGFSLKPEAKSLWCNVRAR